MILPFVTCPQNMLDDLLKEARELLTSRLPRNEKVLSPLPAVLTLLLSPSLSILLFQES
jgi:hypothetical protein